ncbi:MAG TPA: hypothetical protein VFZ35_08665 [Sphingomicrobium sp.]
MIERKLAIFLTLASASCASQEPAGSSADRAEANVAGPANRAQPAAPALSREPIAYTSLTSETCQLIEENKEEAGYSRHRCNGIAGFALETSESDLRNDVVIIAPNGRRSELGLSAKVANGAFNSLGERAEWRGRNAAAPSSLIIRLDVADGAEPANPDTSNLVVVRLASPACIVAVVPPAPNQNEIARDTADNPPASCV